MLSVLILTFFDLCRASPINLISTLDPRDPNTCPLYLPKNDYESPHLIVPVSRISPHASMGNTYSPTMSPNDIATIFNFDIPTSRSEQTCSLFFTFPTQSQLVTSSYSFAGPGSFEFSSYEYGVGAVSETTWATQPLMSNFSTILIGVVPGTSHLVWSGSCGKGGVYSWRMKSLDSCLWYFQDFNLCAIGAYMLYDRN